MHGPGREGGQLVEMLDEGACERRVDEATLLHYTAATVAG
jgi:hypothetical protein